MRSGLFALGFVAASSWGQAPLVAGGIRRLREAGALPAGGTRRTIPSLSPGSGGLVLPPLDPPATSPPPVPGGDAAGSRPGRIGPIAGGTPPRPTDATGFPPNVAPPGGALPDPQQGSQEFRIVRTGSLRRVGDRVVLGGGVEVTARGYRIFADEVERNLATDEVTARGQVQVFGRDARVTGEEITLDLTNRTYRATGGRARVSPALTGGNLRGDLFVSGAISSGSERRYVFDGADLTTCEYGKPHYRIEAGSGTVTPGREARLKRVRIEVLGRDILRFGSLWIPLTDREYRYTPEVGRTNIEGFYIKNRYAFPAKGRDVTEVRLDEMEKLGTGLGLGYGYLSERSAGMVRGYGIFGRSPTKTLRTEHRQRFGFGTLSIENDYQSSNYETAPGATLLNTRANLDLATGPGRRTGLSVNQSSQESSGFSTTNRSLSLTDERPLDARTRSRLQLNYNGSQGSGGGTTNRRETLDVRVNESREINRATLSLDYQRTIPIGEIQNFFGGSDRTPALAISSDARRLLGESASRALPFTTQLGIGQYGDPLNGGQISRGSFLFDFRRAGLFGSQGTSGSRSPWILDISGRYRQTAYSDDTAQYLLGTGFVAGYRVTRKLDVSARYNYLRPYGFSPLLLDRSGTSNLVTLDANAEPLRNFRIGAQTGYDIERLRRKEIAYQQVGLRSEYSLGQLFTARALATYDTFQQAFSSVRLDASVVSGRFQAAVGTRYDGIRHTFGNVNVFFDGLQVGRSRFAGVLAYNGYTSRFDSVQANLTYDLHCVELIAQYSDFGTGFRSGREIRLFLRIKAIPFDSLFGVGRRGQPFGTGTGRDF